MKKTLYTPFNKFVFRSPLFPVKSVLKRECINNEIFNEAIYLASPELLKYDRELSGKKSKLDYTFYKYFSRSCTRCTPFGLFAGCSVGAIGDKTNIELVPVDAYERVTRLDMQYLCSLIKTIENDPFVSGKLIYYVNDSLYKIGNKYRYIEYKYENAGLYHQITAIEESEYIASVLDCARTGAAREKLIDSIALGDISREEAEEFVKELISSQVLISELTPSVVGDDVLTKLTLKLEKISDTRYVPGLKKIKSLLAGLDNNRLGNPVSAYEEIIGIIKNFGVDFTPKFLFQADMYKPVLKAEISKDIIGDINEVLRLMIKLCRTYTNPNLEKFRNAFLKRFEEQEVPLAEVLDSELGLGYPHAESGANDINPLIDNLYMPSGSNPKVSRMVYDRIDVVLLKKYAEAIKNQKNEIKISESDFDFVQPEDIRRPEIAAVMCSVIRDEGESRSIYVKMIDTINGGALLGRFCHLNKDIYDLVKDIADKEAEYEPEIINVEISHLPESRIGNIAVRPLQRNAVLHYISNGYDEVSGLSINISDLTLAVKKGRFVIKSKTLNREIRPRLTCAHNFSGSAIPVYRFLCDMQIEYSNANLNMHIEWNDLMKNLDYLPRIKYKNVILSRQKWAIRKKEIEEAYTKETERDIINFFEEFRQNKNLPDLLVIPESDNELFIDLKNPESIRALLFYMKNKNGVIAEEFLFDPSYGIVKEQNNHFANEMIFIFHK